MLRNKIFIIFVIFMIMSIVSQEMIFAGQYKIKEMTAEVERALNNRHDRYQTLTQLKQQGLIGENNQGYVELLKQDDQVSQIVTAENRDRKVIYTTIARQNNLTEALATIEKVFGQEQRDRAESGMMIQQEDGSWVKK